MTDHVDRILDQWRSERSDLDLSAMSVIARIQRVTRFLEQEMESLLAGFQINLPGFGVLTALLRSGEPYRLSPTELYGSLLVSSGAITNRIDRLTETGLVERMPAQNDRRSTLVGLTPKGMKLTNEALTQHTQQELRLLASFTQSEAEEVAGFLRRLLEELERSPAGGADNGSHGSRPGAADSSTRDVAQSPGV